MSEAVHLPRLIVSSLDHILVLQPHAPHWLILARPLSPCHLVAPCPRPITAYNTAPRPSSDEIRENQAMSQSPKDMQW